MKHFQNKQIISEIHWISTSKVGKKSNRFGGALVFSETYKRLPAGVGDIGRTSKKAVSSTGMPS